MMIDFHTFKENEAVFIGGRKIGQFLEEIDEYSVLIKLNDNSKKPFYKIQLKPESAFVKQ
ncbi:hypothetical protein L0B53_18565 (plasmid) [Vibrio sp. SS-MA-C1-2]|uniref:hypothetical protein n=1 Tax=Vibrio sp. SS-MA-C1-2 TaxID=2908646 RepID=UPI001F25847A|nr:hypothetical protein [Vibrio sp. SS-MA-C1-2]UJF20327.1 hypothetical protein L0B53_18565 [Vibrio sp. SS-MA-C1-2]